MGRSQYFSVLKGNASILAKRKSYLGYLALLAAFTILSIDFAKATHIRAGEITARRVSNASLTYRITLTGYIDIETSTVDFGNGFIDLGDGTIIEDLDFDADSNTTEVLVPGRIEKREYTFTHTFNSPGDYLINYTEINRNANVLNMNRSVETPFYIETLIRIDPFFGVNDTPVLLVPPIDNGGVGVAFFHNPGAFDPNGDSLAYRTEVCRQGVGTFVQNYRFPDNPEFGQFREDGSSPVIYDLNSTTGDIIWDAPGTAGLFNIAFAIEEWRQIGGEWFNLGYVIRDMQIIVEDACNERPELEVPQEICVIAGETIEEVIRGFDPDGDDVIIEAFSGAFDLLSSPARMIPSEPSFMTPPAAVNFEWQTNCSHVRAQPYDVQFRITDRPVGLCPNQSGARGPAFSAFDNWQIRVVGPPPNLAAATLSDNRTVSLNWDEYSCRSTASQMQVWRRVGSNPFEPENCDIGMPEGAGYELIDRVGINQTNYIDEERLAPGATICYRLVAEWDEPGGGESIVSNEICIEVDADAPVMTEVSVLETNGNEGRISISWLPPFDLDNEVSPAPYSYELFRIQGEQRVSIAQLTDEDFNEDGFLNVIDSGINTLVETFRYQVEASDATQTAIDPSAIASSVRLTLIPGVENIVLNWSATVPWSNQAFDHPIHDVYRLIKSPEDPAPTLISDFEPLDAPYASVNVVETGNFRFEDDGQGTPLSDEFEYCYLVLTRGTYGNDSIPSPLLNYSQISCVQPNDTIPPCPIGQINFDNFQGDAGCTEFLSGRPCGFNDFRNTLSWDEDIIDGCDEQILFYEIFFSPSGNETDYELIATVSENRFTHENLSSFKGCYRIRSVDRSGNRSELSEEFCNDNCPQIEFPNIITPNTDGKNDTFRPFEDAENDRCPRFVESIEINIYNRWGKKVFSYNSEDADSEEGIFINWDGRDFNGNLLNPAAYYYEALVTFDVLEPSLRRQRLKGWVHVLY
ncbi:MAG: gliding motility-associated C-terminal domain-containing protein [Cyclobacteriaceae bacterium]|nr:gliding motility-associated C-terminal domain-containing protein [Cyclobacteriaceae bacterium]MCH8516939.1 gliding motility-associated C-terminal domain-containing protein [Cyclobacteriaceae bacterium]